MNKHIIYKFLLERIGNPIGVCALMGNLYVESGLKSTLLERSKADRMGITSAEYCFKVDREEIDRETFSHDQAGFGLAQWTYWSRKQGLYDYAKQTGRGIAHLQMQLEYLWQELSTYKKVIKALKEATDLRTASDIVCLQYEKPKNTSEKYLQNRANYGFRFYDEFFVKMGGKKEETENMYSAKYVDDKIKELKGSGKSPSDQAWELAKACVGWAYVFGAYGEYCDPTNRRARASKDHPTIQSKCKNFRGRDDVPSGCVGCQWFLGTNASDESKHEGRTRFFDCRGFVYFVLHKLFGMWKSCPAGATTMWNTESNWEKKGLVKDGVPNDTLVCLFYPEKDGSGKMAHIGFGYKGETIECQSGVEYHAKYNAKWTHWAIPKCITAQQEPEPEPGDLSGCPTLRQGSKGDIVKTMQQLLKNTGSNLAVDGIFGNGTRSALAAFQKKNGLEADGVCGPLTWSALIGASVAKTDGRKLNITLFNVPEEEAAALINKYSGEVVGLG